MIRIISTLVNQIFSENSSIFYFPSYCQLKSQMTIPIGTQMHEWVNPFTLRDFLDKCY